MSNYLEVKKVFCKVMSAKDIDLIDENSDVYIPIYISSVDGKTVIYSNIPNEMIYEAFQKYKSQSCEGAQLYSSNRYEAAVLSSKGLNAREISINDSENDITYRVGNASLEYIMMICDQMRENPTLFSKNRQFFQFLNLLPYRSGVGAKEHIARVFHVKTISIVSEKNRELDYLKKCCSSFEFLFMYKTRESIIKVHHFDDIYNQRGGGRARCSEVDEPPRRTVNTETLEFYAMAVETDDPFTAYISFYHVLEYYFDAVYREKFISEMRERITDPSFSYKDEKKLYGLAKWVKKKLKNDDENGRGNELESLKYVLEEYVPIQKLMDALDEWNVTYKEYYSNHNVGFADTSKGCCIAWSDTQGVYTNLAKRIYSTRNALVHSKSEHSESQYKPLKNKMELEKELPLIQIIAELILIKDGEVL